MAQTITVFGTPHEYDLTGPEHAPFTIVFVHGWLLSRLYWRPIIHRLSGSYRCLSYDLRGFGSSQPVSEIRGLGVSEESRGGQGHLDRSKRPLLLDRSSPQSSYTPLAYAQDLIGLLTHLKIERAWVIGHSLGGSISLWACDHSPQRILGAICVNSGGGIYLKEEFEQFRSVGQQLINFRPKWLPKVPLMDRLMMRMSVASPIPRPWGQQRVEDWVKADPEAALRSLLDSTTEEEVHQLPQLVSRLRQPAYFIAGAKDTVMEPKYVNHLASFHYSFQQVGHNVSDIPDCGHMAMLEQPERLTEKIREILALHNETL
ncbi:MAG: alpha/beta hydrolase [Cyanobacteria bacterium P01_F01_bin.150]